MYKQYAVLGGASRVCTHTHFTCFHRSDAWGTYLCFCRRWVATNMAAMTKGVIWLISDMAKMKKQFCIPGLVEDSLGDDGFNLTLQRLLYQAIKLIVIGMISVGSAFVASGLLVLFLTLPPGVDRVPHFYLLAFFLLCGCFDVQNVRSSI